MKSKTQSKDRMNIMLGLGISALVIITVIFYGLAAVTGGTFDISELLLIGPAIALAIAAAFMIKDRMKSVRAGLPAEDEMSRKGLEKAGYYSYLVTIYIALGIGFVSDAVQMTVSVATGLIILVSAIVFIGLAIYYRNKGV